MTRLNVKVVIIICLLISLGACSAYQRDEPAKQKMVVAIQTATPNLFLADAPFPIVHAGSGFGIYSAIAGPVDVKRPLTGDEIRWIPTELASWAVNYSAAYPDGRRVAWSGGNRQLFKYDADTLELLATLQIRPGNPMSGAEVAAYVDKLDGLEKAAYYKLSVGTLLPEMDGATSFYKIISNDNEVYMLVNDRAQQRTYLRVYGDAIAGDPASAIELKRELALPKVTDIAPVGFSVNMTYDGRLIVTTRDGTVFSISRDLTNYDYLVIPGGGKIAKGMSNSFIRNAPPIDPNGGIYLVTHDTMMRMQWTGEKLSLSPKDGAWSAPYASGKLGSGTSPALMGWGENDDQLVLIGDGRPDGDMHLLAFWRDKIPSDWQGIAGQDRRVAGRIGVDFGKHTSAAGPMENSMPIKGYGVMVSNDNTPKQPDYGTSSEESLLVQRMAVSKETDMIPHGVNKYDWDSAARKFVIGWKSDMAFTTSIPVVDVNDTVYAIGWREGLFTMEAVDWRSGQSKYFYNLGTGNRFNQHGSSLSIAPNGALDCPCQGGVGIVRIHPDRAAP